MEYAVIETGGKQYKVKPGDVVNIEKLDTEKGEKVTFEKVIFYAKENEKITGAPYVKNVSVEGEVLSQIRAKKVLVFKYKPKKRVRTKNGHRQNYTKVKIEKIAA